jgi:hypothetical protein
MAEEGKELADKPDDLSLIPGAKPCTLTSDLGVCGGGGGGGGGGVCVCVCVSVCVWYVCGMCVYMCVYNIYAIYIHIYL